jgi:hypothetical protein
MAKVPTADEIASSFLERPMPIIGKPTRALLIPLCEIVHASASQIQTTLGGGIYGYLGAMLQPDVYTALDDAEEFEIPEHPGNVLADKLASTQYAITDALRANKEKLRQYDEYNTVMQALRKQIIDTVKEEFIMSLRNKYTIANTGRGKQLMHLAALSTSRTRESHTQILQESFLSVQIEEISTYWLCICTMTMQYWWKLSKTEEMVNKSRRILMYWNKPRKEQN